MKHFDESVLEKYLLQPGAIEAAVKRDIEGHLATCEECSRIIEFLKEFYTKLAQKRREGVTSQVKSFLDKAFPAQAAIIRLFTFKPEVQPMPSAPAVLAAKSESEMTKIFKTVAVFASENEEILLRITYNRETGLYKLSVKATDPKRYANVVLSIPALSQKITTDEYGTATFTLSSEDRNIDFEKLDCFIEYKAERM